MGELAMGTVGVAPFVEQTHDLVAFGVQQTRACQTLPCQAASA